MDSIQDHLTDYEIWEQGIKQELRFMGYSWEAIDKAEICENGQVHFHGSLWDITKKGFVTPYDKF
jgi:hypothetical protein